MPKHSDPAYDTLCTKFEKVTEEMKKSKNPSALQKLNSYERKIWDKLSVSETILVYNEYFARLYCTYKGLKQPDNTGIPTLTKKEIDMLDNIKVKGYSLKELPVVLDN